MKILLTGDSIIARKEGLSRPRLNVELGKLLPKVKIFNTAISGINSGGFFSLINQTVFRPEKCDKLVLLLGTNDLALHKQVPLARFKQNMSLISSALICHYYPEQVLLISPPAVDEEKQHVRTNALVKKYSDAVEEIASEYGFAYLNLAQAMIEQGDLAYLCRGIKNDGLHFGVAGYKLLARLIARELTSC